MLFFFNDTATTEIYTLSLHDALPIFRVRLRTPRGPAEVVNGLSYTVGRGETVAVVGESGSGKSVSVLALLGLLPARVATVTGSERLDGEDLLTMSPERLREVRGPGVGMVFQDPRSEEHTSELQSRQYLVCRLLLEKKKISQHHQY